MPNGGSREARKKNMKKLFSLMLVMASMLCVCSSCSKDENLPEKEDSPVEHPNGIPSNIPNNIIYYITSDNTIVRFSNSDVFGGAKIVSNIYSSTKGYGTIEFASEVTAIESKAFIGKTTLTYIAIPNSVTSIGYGAFGNCSGLTSVTIPYSVASIGENAFYGCTSLTSVTIGNGVTSIGDGAFYECSGLTSVTIPNSVTKIGDSAFAYCSGLTSVTIPNSVTKIGGNAFEHCDGLTSVHFSDIVAWCNIEFKGYYSNPVHNAHHLYLNGEEVRDLIIPNSVTNIGDYAFCGYSGLTSVTIGNGVTSIGKSAFERCSDLTSIVVEEGNSVYDSRNSCNAIVETASNTLIYGCKTTIIPNSVTSIGESAFEGCSGLTSVTIPNSVASIGKGAFSDCDGLTSVTIGNGVTSIGDWAFSYCSELLDVYCYAEKVPSTESNAFDKSSIAKATLHVPAASIDSYKATVPWNSFGKIVALTE